jgi:hypothetical protein
MQEKHSSTSLCIVHPSRAEAPCLYGELPRWTGMANGMVCGFLNAKRKVHTSAMVSSHGQLVDDSGSINIALSKYER